MAMKRSSEAAARLLEIEQQQDEILLQLEELERRTEAVLAQHAPYPPAIPADPQGQLREASLTDDA
jgi:hypothetical protein